MSDLWQEQRNRERDKSDLIREGLTDLERVKRTTHTIHSMTFKYLEKERRRFTWQKNPENTQKRFSRLENKWNSQKTQNPTPFSQGSSSFAFIPTSSPNPDFVSGALPLQNNSNTSNTRPQQFLKNNLEKHTPFLHSLFKSSGHSNDRKGQIFRFS